MWERKPGSSYPAGEILPRVILNSWSQKERINLDGDLVKIATMRLQVFAAKGTTCTVCGVKGTVFYKERNTPGSWHLNLYGTLPDGVEVLMTRDHTIPRSKGGPDTLDNQEPMCHTCNNGLGHKGKLSHSTP